MDRKSGKRLPEKAWEGQSFELNDVGAQRAAAGLKKGISREARYCFRLYFCYDEETQQVVVGWLPSHLDTRAT